VDGAESLLRTARAAGIDVCFANPGTTEMPLVAALDAVPGIRPVLGVFEGVCTGAADGYARMAQRPALTLLHLGPGLANGLANLHNAHRAHTPVVNLVGEHATWHRGAQSPLESDIEALARTVSGWVRTSKSAGSLASDLCDAVAAATRPPGQVATLVVPADHQSGAATSPAPLRRSVEPKPPDADRVDAAARALRCGPAVALLLGGPACRPEALASAARIAEATACRLFVETFPARCERGAGAPILQRMPYFPEQVAQAFEGVTHVVLAGAPEPVAMFGWAGARSALLPEGVERVPLADADEDVASALAAVADALGAARHFATVAPHQAPPPPSGRLDAAALACAVARALPDHAIVVDEGATSSLALYDALASAAPHSWLTLTGGAIGQGLPCATGAAIACRDRKVVAFQADGSALFTLQALWTQARESLDVTTVICANRAYRILQIELLRAGAGAGGAAARALTELADPAPDWVDLASGMGVPAERATDADSLVRALDRALAEPGPRLVEAILT
jgi:acetolactate synthase-1/2/3 large subunit